MRYRAQLSDVEFKEIAGLQDTVTAEQRKAADRMHHGFQTQDQLVTSTLWQYWRVEEKDYTPAQRDARAQLMRVLDHAVALHRTNHAGKDPSTADVQNMLDKVLSNKTPDQPGSWMNLLHYVGPVTDPNARRLITRPGRALLDLTIADVPAGDRTTIEGILRKNGLAINDRTILDFYIEKQAGLLK